MINETLKAGKKLYFLSDAHLGLPPREKSLEREKKLVALLSDIQKDAHAIFLMGDIFDYWFEHRKVIPRGFTRFLGKLSELGDQGIPVYFFTGNHDVWVFDYLPTETGIIVKRQPETHIYNGKKFYLAHGDGLGKGEWSYRILKKIFVSKTLQWLYARIHPNTSTALAHYWSKSSRLSKGNFTPFLGNEKEHLVIHSMKLLSEEHYDYFVYGHRHLPLVLPAGEKSKIIYIGDWFVNFTYAVFDGQEIELIKV